MADFTTQKTWEVGDTVPAADMNTYLRDDMQYLYDNATLLIAEESVTTSDVGTITFDSISGDFSSLLVVFSFASQHTSQDYLWVSLNGDTSTDSYIRVRRWYDAYTANISPYGHIFDNFYVQPSTNTGQWNYGEIRFTGYSNTNSYTFAMAQFIDPVNYLHWFHNGIYSTTDAVTSMTFNMGSGNYAIGSKISLYGYR